MKSDIDNPKPGTARRYSVQIATFGTFERWCEVAASSREGSSNAIAWLWAKHDTSARVRVVDTRSGRVTMTPEAIASIP